MVASCFGSGWLDVWRAALILLVVDAEAELGLEECGGFPRPIFVQRPLRHRWGGIS